MDAHGAFVGTMIALNLAIRGGILLFKSNYLLKFLNVKCSQNLVNLGNPFLSSILIQNLPKKCPICWVSHMFSI